MANTASNLQSRVRELKDRSVEAVSGARDRVVAETREAAQKLDREAHRSPWKFVGIAAAFTAVFGFLLGRKSKRDPRR